MARLVYFGVELYGHVFGSLGLIRKLIEKGEEVIYYCSENFREVIEYVGARFESYGELPPTGNYDGNGIDTFFVFAEFLIEKCKRITNELIDDIKEYNPDYIIHDAFCCWGKQFARILNIPGISLSTHYPFINEMSEANPKLFFDSILRVADDSMHRIYKDNPVVYNKLINKMTRAISKKHNLPNLNIVNDIFGSKEELNILPTSKEFQLYSECFDDSYIFCGYHSVDNLIKSEFPYEKLDSRPIVYISFGTIFNNAVDFYKRCIKAFENSDVQVIISTGKVELHELGHIPDNIIARQFVPQVEILKLADVFISHGGTNSVCEAINAEVPMLVLPQAFDQFIGGLIVENSKVGIYIKKDDISSSELKAVVENVLSNTEYKNNCTRIKESFIATGGLEYAVDEIFRYINHD